MVFIITTVVIAALAAIIISLTTIRSLRRQLENIQTGITQFSQGNLDHRISVPDSRYFDSVTETLNTMATVLDKRIDTITSQRNELEAVFSGMSEGVVVTDDHQRIIAINTAGASLLNVDVAAAAGRGIQEIIYNPELQQLLTEVLRDRKTVEKDLLLYKEKKRHLQVCGSFVDTANGGRAVIVLSDMTQIYQLENVRREFVSNVSHELKTPVTSIKVAVETLLDGAMNDPTESKNFLEIIARHANRLNAIIEDILNLSRIEQEVETRRIVTEVEPIKPVLTAAVTACQSKTAEKQMTIVINCDERLAARLNSPLLEQAVINLVENAIKYSDPHKTITLSAQQNNDEVAITIGDEGYGIDAEHLPRIFERFYVADKARSRKVGGTGLGLAIVKHIVNAHGGNICVESHPGKGSTFTITLPFA